MKTALASAFSGLLWGLLGAYLTSRVFGPISWFTVPSGVLIGLIVFRLSRWAYRKPFWILIPTALISTFFAVGLFGLSLGFADLMRLIPNQNRWAVVVQGMNACLMGLVIYPPLWSLFLLSFGNHALIRYLFRADPQKA